MTQDRASGAGWLVAVVGAVAVVCCLAWPALAGRLGGAVLWGVGRPVGLVIAVVLAGAYYALLGSQRGRRRSSP